MAEVTNIWLKYEQLVKSRSWIGTSQNQSELAKWKDHLFIQFLIYCFPVCLIAVIPCVYVSLTHGYIVLGLFDGFCFLLTAIITFSGNLTLQIKKAALITMFYALAVFLIASLGYIGPGIFYLLGITIFVALFFPIRLAYLSILFNATILVFFALEIQLKLFPLLLNQQYTLAAWFAFSSNLIFLGIMLVMLIQTIFNGLLSTIEQKQRNEIKYRNIFEHSPLPMWVFEMDTLRFLDVNQAAVDNYEYSRTEFLQMTIKDIRPKSNASDIENLVRLNNAKYKSYQENFIHTKKSGKAIFVKVQSSPLEFDGRPAKLVSAVDISIQRINELKIIRSNHKLKQSELNLRAIFDSAIQGFLLLDKNNKILTFNPKAKGSILAGDANIKLEGKSIFDFIEGSKKAYFRNALQKVHQGELIEYSRKHTANGQTLWVQYTLTPVREGDGIVGASITGYDVTEQKKYIKTIEAQNKKFQEINWIQSHSVRAPLARIMGLINLLLIEKSHTEKQKILKMLQVSSGELDSIIRDITEKIANTTSE
jgi:PAS domain S-box-containing protein